ncbi:MAG: glycosyltransferase family 39 protein [Pyrinomonadaceae bacterium]
MKLESNNYIIPAPSGSTAGETSDHAKGSFRPFSILFFVLGAVVMVWSIRSDLFRNAENSFLTAEFCLPLTVGLGLFLMGFLVGTKWRNFAFWTALAAAGQAAALQMIDAGPLIHFQFYRSIPEQLNRNPVAVALIAVQFVLIAFAIGKHLPGIIGWINKTFAKWQLFLMAGFLFFAGAAVTPNYSIYLTSLATAFLVQLIGLANIILAIRSLPEEVLRGLRRKYLRIFAYAEEKERPGLDKFALFSALWIVLIAGALSYFVYQVHPHVPDETQYFFQAKNMAAGQLTSKAPLVPEAFSMYMVPSRDARWYGIFPPAFPVMLAIGLKLGAVWLVNPLLAGLCVLLAYLFFQEIYSLRFARIGVLLLCCSPWFIFMAMSFMSHIFLLACSLGAAVLLARSLRKEKIGYAFGAGLMVGIVSLIRPLDGLLVAVLLGFWALIKCRTWTMRFLTGACLTVGTIITGALVLPYNKAITGDPMLLPMNAYYTKYFWKDVMALGFGANRGLDWGLDAFPGHSPLEAMVNAALNTFSLNIELLGWATGSLLLAVCFLFSGRMKRKDLWAPVVIVAVLGSYSFYWYSGGPDFGARYWFLIIIPLIALTVRAVEFLGDAIRENRETQVNARVMTAVLLLCGITLVCYIPWRALDKYYHYLGMQPGVERLARQNDFGRSLVLIRGQEHPDFQSAWIYNPLDFEGDAPVYAWDKNPEIRQKLLQNYKDRQVWIVNGPTLTNGGYQIVRGPVSADQLLAEQSQ